MAEPKCHVFGLSLAQGWVVMTDAKVYMAESKVHAFDFSVA
jgi:hypothetical protein